MTRPETAITHPEACQLAARWLIAQESAERVLIEPPCKYGENPDVIGLIEKRSAVAVIEVKVSRSDWLRDADKPHRRNGSMGQVVWVCAPPGVVKPEELPIGWGLLIIAGIEDGSPYIEERWPHGSSAGDWKSVALCYAQQVTREVFAGESRKGDKWEPVRQALTGEWKPLTELMYAIEERKSKAWWRSFSKAARDGEIDDIEANPTGTAYRRTA